MLSILLLSALSGLSIADDTASPSVEQAIQIVDKPADGFDNMSPFELQTHYRLMSLLHEKAYQYEEKHAEAWINCMRDKRRSMYARLCAAYFLADLREEAREFIVTQLKSEDLRHRYNAAEIVELYVGRNAEKEWGIDVLIKLLADGSLDGSGVEGSPAGKYPQGDRNDIMFTPIDGICWSLGFMKEKKAVPVLISVLERRPRTGGAAFALGEIEDKRAVPILMKILKDRSGYEDREVTALGNLKHVEAVPILISRLSKPRTKYGGSDIIETEKLLDALLEIGDLRSVEPIEKYIQGDYPEKSKAVARRVLVQLKSPDAVAALLVLLNKETYEPERSDIISALVKKHDVRVITKLSEIAQTSDSAFMRREAIFGLSKIGDRQSLLILASLLDLTWPKNLKAEWGWKGLPDFETYFPETIQLCLKQCTKQDFGKDKSRWKDWIEKIVEPKDTLDKE